MIRSSGISTQFTPPSELEDVRRIVFFKRDELMTDLVCCEVEVDAPSGPLVYFYHEEYSGWDDLLEWLGRLAGFDHDGREKVILPPFAKNRTVVFERQSGPRSSSEN